jgi:Ca2+-binding RTX toxin-like protein
VTQATLQAAEAPGTLRLVNPGAVHRVETAEHANGASDAIDGGQGNDVILAGNGADVIDTGAGHNIAFGDGGLVDYVLADGDAGDIDRIESLAFAIGDSDTI